MTNEEQLEQQIAKALSSYFEAGHRIARTALEHALWGKPNVSSSRSMAKAARERTAGNGSGVAPSSISYASHFGRRFRRTRASQ